MCTSLCRQDLSLGQMAPRVLVEVLSRSWGAHVACGQGLLSERMASLLSGQDPSRSCLWFPSGNPAAGDGAVNSDCLGTKNIRLQLVVHVR